MSETISSQKKTVNSAVAAGALLLACAIALFSLGFQSGGSARSGDPSVAGASAAEFTATAGGAESFSAHADTVGSEYLRPLDGSCGSAAANQDSGYMINWIRH